MSQMKISPSQLRRQAQWRIRNADRLEQDGFEQIKKEAASDRKRKIIGGIILLVIILVIKNAARLWIRKS